LKIIYLLIIIATGMLLVYGTIDMPEWADPNSPASRHLSPAFITRTIEDTHTPNIVTSVLADYRGYDTLGETTVVFCAGMACILLLKKWREKNKGV